MEEEMLALFLYGYNEKDAKTIKENYSLILNKEIHVFSGSQNEEKIIDEIIDFNFPASYEDKEPKILMFLGFTEQNISLALNAFPSGDVPRPIMCTLTQTNRFWPVKELTEHLLEEEKRWKEKQNKQA